MVVHDFKESIKIGELGEVEIFKKLKEVGGVRRVRDVRNNPTYQNQDVDFLLYFEDDTMIKVEVKTDTYDSENLFYETYSCLEWNRKGCMEKTNAKLILYYFIPTKELYVLDRESFIEWVHNNEKSFEKRSLKNKRYDGSHYTSEGYLINKSYLEENFNNYNKTIIDKETIKLIA